MPARPSPTRSDHDLVDAARRGDREAFAELYQRYFNAVFDFVTRMTRDREEAADIAQDTFIKAFERLQTLENGERFKTWVFTIARNETLDRLRRSKRVRPLTVVGEDGEVEQLDVVDPDRLSDPSVAAEANAVASLVWEAAAGLDPRQLSILDLHLRQGLNSAEIAEVMGVTRNNGYVMLNRLKEAVGATIEALLLLRQGQADCDELAELVESFETQAMSPELRRAISRHATNCDACTERKRVLVSPLAVMSALAPIPVSQAVSDDILEHVLERMPVGGDVQAALAEFAEEGNGDASTLVALDGPTSDIPAVGDAWLSDLGDIDLDDPELEPDL